MISRAGKASTVFTVERVYTIRGCGSADDRIAGWRGDSDILSLHPRLGPRSASTPVLSDLLFRLAVLVSSESPIQVGDGISTAEEILADSHPTKHFFPLLEIEILADPPFLKASLVLTFARDRLMLQVDGSDVHEQRRAICDLEMAKSTDQKHRPK